MSLVVDPDDTASAEFQLQQGAAGSYVGQIAIDFTLEDDFAADISLHNYRGRIVILSFFFSRCQPCMAEFPEIEEIYQEYANHGVRVLGIDTMWFGEQLADVQNVRSSLGLTFNLLLDYGAVVTQQYSIAGCPTNIIIDRGGEIVSRLGSTSYSELAGILDGLLN